MKLDISTFLMEVNCTIENMFLQSNGGATHSLMTAEN